MRAGLLLRGGRQGPVRPRHLGRGVWPGKAYFYDIYDVSPYNLSMITFIIILYSAQ